MEGFLNYIIDTGYYFRETADGVFDGQIGDLKWRLFYLKCDDQNWISIRKDNVIIAQFEDLDETIEFIQENS